MLIDEEDAETMTRMSLFNSPFLLGFEPFEEALERVSKASSDGYPPYNVEQLDDHRLRITLAVAGFAEDELDIQMAKNQLTVRGRQKDDAATIYLHRGIAARQFQRSFVLADGIEVSGASLDKGLLHIELNRPVDHPQVRTIRIETGTGTDRGEGLSPSATQERRSVRARGGAKS